MYERKSDPLLPRHKFVQRLGRHALFSLVIIAIALGIGIVGYRVFAELDFLDALLNASMILSGMGPVLTTMPDAAKLFASFYALFSGVIFISSVGIVAAPLAHRLLHHFHLDENDKD